MGPSATWGDPWSQNHVAKNTPEVISLVKVTEKGKLESDECPKIQALSRT